MTNGERKLCEYMHKRTGSFYTSLFKCMAQADKVNLARLGMGFPEESVAWNLYRSEDDYWDKLDTEWNGGKK